MELGNIPMKSGRICLADVLPAFAEFEGDLPVDQRAYVIVRRAEARDDLRRDEIVRPRLIKYTNPITLMPVEETTEALPGEVMKWEVYWTVQECVNLTINGVPVLTAKPLASMKVGDFEAVWNTLPLEVSLAIGRAVRVFNRMWS